MRVVISSLFRDSAGAYLVRYVNQLAAFKDALVREGHVLRWMPIEGDSIDATRVEIARASEYLPISMELITRNFGHPVYGSTELPARLEASSYVCNGVFENVREDDDVLVFVESDLLWKPDVMMRLIAQLAPGLDVILPMIFVNGTETFYDIWGFRKNGTRFGPFTPYHHNLNPVEVTRIDTGGSCLVMRAEVARRCRIIDNMALVGFCQDAWAKGFTVQVDPRERIYHP